MAAEKGEGRGPMEITAEGRRTIKLKSSDGLEREMSVEAANLCKTIGRVIGDDLADNPSPFLVSNVASNALDLAIAYCQKHAEVAPAAGSIPDPSSGSAGTSSYPAPATAKDALEKWDKELVDGLEQRPLFDLILAAHYLEITGLLDLTCDKVAGMIDGKTPKQIRTTFNIINDYTKEEEDEVRKEYGWAFDD